MSSALATSEATGSVPLPPVPLASIAAADGASGAVIRQAAPRDPIKMLASFIAQSLLDRMGEQASASFLNGLFGSFKPRRTKGLTIARLIDLYMEHAETYYRHPDGTPTTEVSNTECSLRSLRQQYGRTRVEDFGPLKLKALREEMLKAGWCRKTINQRIGCVKRIFKWGVENEVVPADRFHALQAVAGLKLGRTLARVSEPVRPVPEALVEATLPHVSAQVGAMIRLQLLTGT